MCLFLKLLFTKRIKTKIETLLSLIACPSSLQTLNVFFFSKRTLTLFKLLGSFLNAVFNH